MKNILICSMVLILSLPVWAGAGTTGLDFLKLGGGARPLAMGQAYTGLADDVSAIYYNPAGLGQIEFQEIMTMSNYWLAGMTQVMAGAVFPTRYGVWGVGYSSLASGDIQGYGPTGEVTSIFNTGSSAINLSFARWINPLVSLGAGIKMVSERLESVSGNTTALDLGLQYHANPNLTFGVAALNLGGPVKFVSEETKLPASYRAGAAFTAHLMGETINLAGDLVNYSDGTKINLGMEYVIREMLALRVGSDGGVMRAGLGITANLLALDYAYRADDVLGATHQVSLSLLFGAPQEAKKRVLENMALGKAYIKEKKYADAIIVLQRVLELDPRQEEAALELARAKSELETDKFRQVFAKKEAETKRDAASIMDSGKTYMKDGKYLEALGEFSNVLKIEPTNSEALKLQSEAQFRMESQLIAKSKEEAKQYLGEAMKLVVLGRYKEALSQVNLALGKDPNNKEALALKKKLELIMNIERK